MKDNKRWEVVLYFVKATGLIITMTILGAVIGGFFSLHPIGIGIGAAIGLVIGLERFVIFFFRSKNKLGWFSPIQRSLNRIFKILIAGVIMGIFGMIAGGTLLSNSDAGSQIGALFGAILGMLVTIIVTKRSIDID